MLGLLVRLVVSAVVLMLVSWLLPGFATLTSRACPDRRGGDLSARLYRRKPVWGKISPQNRGLVGFITATIVIYVAQFIIPGMTVSFLGAALAAVIIGIVDLFVPTELR